LSDQPKLSPNIHPVIHYIQKAQSNKQPHTITATHHQAQRETGQPSAHKQQKNQAADLPSSFHFSISILDPII